MVFEYRYQPFKGLFLTYQAITTTFIRIPFWFATSIPRFLRPRQSWDWKRAFRLKLIKHLSYVAGKINLRARGTIDHTALVEGVKGVWVDPVPESLIVDEVKSLATAAQVHPSRLPGYWIDRDGADASIVPPAVKGEKVLYHLHGGGYTDFSANPKDVTALIGHGLLEHCPAINRVFSIEYRLSTAAPLEPVHPFPTALIDALSGYYYLVDVVGFAPDDIIVEGDSAGGNLALALTRYPLENQTRTDGLGFPALPGALILLSPWSDMGSSHEGPGSSYDTNLVSDHLPKDMLYHKRALVGPLGLEAADSNPYISPSSKHLKEVVSFRGFPRTFINAGGAEVFKDQIRTLNEMMVRDMGEGKVTYYEAPDAMHDYIANVWHEPERTETLKIISEWVVVGV